MGDEHYPYEKAAEATAKATSNAIDLIREGGRAIAPAVGNIYGILIGDKVAAARERRLDEITRKTNKILEDRDVGERQEIPEDIAIPLLEAAQGESREELQDLWARLLANAMDPQRSNNVRAEFITILRRFEVVDARVFFYLHGQTTPWNRLSATAADLSLRPSAAEIAIKHLVELGCLERQTSDHSSVHLTSLGKELFYSIEP